jgi:hypothetical protein
MCKCAPHNRGTTSQCPLAHLRWISDALVEAVSNPPKDVEIAIRIFVTGPASAGAIEWDDEVTPSGSGAGSSLDIASPITPYKEGIKGTTSDFALLSMAPVSLTQGRPNLSELLSQEADRLDGGRMSVSGKLSSPVFPPPSQRPCV